VSDDDLSQEIIRLVWSFDLFLLFAAVETEFGTFALIFGASIFYIWAFSITFL
jgi:hypothetical protein